MTMAQLQSIGDKYDVPPKPTGEVKWRYRERLYEELSLIDEDEDSPFPPHAPERKPKIKGESCTSATVDEVPDFEIPDYLNTKPKKKSFHRFSVEPRGDGPLTGANCIVKMDGEKVKGLRRISFDVSDNELATIKLELYAGFHLVGDFDKDQIWEELARD